MRRALRIAAIGTGIAVLATAGLFALVLVAANTTIGARLVEQVVLRMTHGEIAVEGLSGPLLDAPRIARVELRDPHGTWLSADNIRVQWSAASVLSGTATIDWLNIESIRVNRPPAPAGPPKPFKLVLPTMAHVVEVARLDLAPALIGTPAAFRLTGSGTVFTFDDNNIDARAERLDGSGHYTATTDIDGSHVAIRVTADEPAGGFLSVVGKLPAIGAITATATLEGPRQSAALTAKVAAGELRAEAHGRINIVDQTADLAFAAQAPAMAPRPDLSWRSVAVDAHVRGSATAPEASGTVRIEDLTAAGASAASVNADLAGDKGRVRLNAEVAGIRVPGPNPDLLATAPLKLSATVELDRPARPVSFTLTHPLLGVNGSAETNGAPHGTATVTMPDLAPLAAMWGVDARGRAEATLSAAMAGDAVRLAATAAIDVASAPAPAGALLGDRVTLDVAASLAGQTVVIDHARVAGRAVSASAEGSIAPQQIAVTWAAGLDDLQPLAPGLTGNASARGNLAGRPNALTATADLTGQIARSGVRSGPLQAHLSATGLPSAPSLRVEANGQLDGAPLDLAMDLRRATDGALHADIERAAWKSAHAGGTLDLAAGARLPRGHIDAAIGQLGDLKPLLGQDIAGAIDGAFDIGNAAEHPTVGMRLKGTGLRFATVTGNIQLDASGPARAIGFRMTASGSPMPGRDATIEAAGTLDAESRALALASLTATSSGETMRLLAPARLDFANGVTVDRLGLGLRGARVEVAGRMAPNLDLTAAGRNLLDLAPLAVPGLQIAGALQADARITGAPDRLAGTARLTGSGLRLTAGPAGGAIPPAELTATATLGGDSASIDARVTAGSKARLTLTGQVPLRPQAPLNLRLAGSTDLTLLNPLIAAAGSRARGEVTLDASVAGSLEAPVLAGSATLIGGDVQDAVLGAHLTAMAAHLRLEGQTLRIASLSMRAGQGTISATGSLGVLAPDLPVDLAVTARNAEPVDSDRLNATIDADMTVRGAATGHLDVGGSLHVQQADIRVPEKLPPRIAVLDVRRPGVPPPPPQAPPPDIGLNVTVDAPNKIFVRGRGIDAELGGRLALAGTLAQPAPHGDIKLIHGNYSIAGITLVFTEGDIRFNGGNALDPALHLVTSQSSGTISASLTIAGTASAPQISLSSSPDLPQDEILARLLFNQSAVNLNPFQLAQIGGALAQISGVGGGIDPLGSIRNTLGLDRLSVEGGTNGSVASLQAPRYGTPGTATGTGPALQAGRYIAPGVMIGARQGLGGTETQATVQVDITKGLKLEGAAGTGLPNATGSTSSGAGGSIGLTYQFEY